MSSLKTLNNFIESLVDIAVSQRKQGIQLGLFTEALSLLTKDRTVLRDQIVNILLPKKDSTAATLSWLFYELSYHPEVYARLRSEVLSVVGLDGKPSHVDLKQMKYMQSCLHEGTFHYSSE